MLGKLFKYEMKASGRLLLPMFLVLIALSIMDRIILGLDFFKGTLAVVPGMITFLFVLACIAIAVFSSIIVIYRFYKNMVTDEGYLMFTLPVKPHQLINSKLIAGSLWVIISIVVVIAALLLDFGTLAKADVFWDGLKQLMSEFRDIMGNQRFVFFIEMIIAIIISIPCSILQVYVSIALGQLFSGHKILGSVVSYVVLTTVLQIITVIIMVVVSLITQDSPEDIKLLTKVIMPLTLVISLAFAVLCYWLTNFLFNKKLNLE